MKPHRALGTGLLVVAVLAIGCGGDKNENTNNHGDTSVPIERAASTIAGMFCGILDTCVGPLADSFLPNCDATLQAQFEDKTVAQWQAAIARGTASYDAAKMKECLDAMRALGCGMFNAQQPDVCKDAIKGTVASGGACHIDEECTSELFCDVDTACPGICATRLAASSPCNRTSQCTGALQCVNGACGTSGGEGSACQGNTSVECGSFLTCIGANGQTPGSCELMGSLATAGSGEACRFGQAPMVLCQAGYYCALQSVASGTFEMTFSCDALLTTAGATCRLGVPSGCLPAEYCDITITVGTPTGTCTPLPIAGQDCLGSDNSARCAPSLACDDAATPNPKCVEVERLTSTCTADVACYSQVCDAGVCAAPLCSTASN